MVSFLIDRAMVRAAKSRRFVAPWALRAALRANELLGLAIGARLAELRDSGDRLARSFDEERQTLPFLTRNAAEMVLGIGSMPPV